MGIRLMIIELRKYNEIGELLIGMNCQVAGTSKLSGRSLEASVTRAAVCMGEGTEM